MLQIQAKENRCIDLGRRGEDSAREILFDISGWAELYGQGEAQLIAKRDRDLSTYPVSITQNHTTVSWIVKPVDNDQPGYGNCELVYITDNHVVKSVTYQTHTEASLSDPVSSPDSPSTYGSIRRDIGNLNDLQTKSKDSLVSAVNEVLNSGGNDTVSKDFILLQSITPGSSKVFKITVDDSGTLTVSLFKDSYEPDEPSEPEVPDEPDVPDVPEIPDEPDIPEEPKVYSEVSILGIAMLGALQLGSY